MLTGWRLCLSKLFIIPQRYVFGIMAALAIANAYTMRVCLNLAITQMVKKKPNLVEGDEHYDPDACPDPTETLISNATSLATDYLRADDTMLFEWSEATQGLLLSAFYYGYVLTHIPGGMMAERYGGKWVLGLGLLVTAIGTLVTPMTVAWGGAPALFALRAIEGFGEGPTMPAIMVMISRWGPKVERARMGALVFGGAQIGNIAGSYLSGLIMSSGHWENVFYFFGSLGVLWFIFWIILCYSTPNTHPFISDQENKYLNANVDSLIHGDKKDKMDPVPWKALLRSVPLWALIIAGIGHDWGYFTVITDLPKYMTDVLKFNIKTAGFLASLPYVAMWISCFFFGLIADFCVKKGYHSILTARKIYTTIAATGPAICIIMASYSGCDTTLAVLWFILAMTVMGAYYSGMKINALDISPNYAGTTTAMVNGIAALSGIVSPYLIGILTPDSTLKQWRVAFWVCFGVLTVTNLVYIIWAAGEQQWWDDVKNLGYPADWKHGPLPSRPGKDAEGQKNETDITETEKH